MVLLDLRQAIVNRVQDKTGDELNDIITDSIDSDERALPGLGVLFEMIWKNCSAPEKSKLVNTLYTHLHSNEPAGQ